MKRLLPPIVLILSVMLFITVGQSLMRLPGFAASAITAGAMIGPSAESQLDVFTDGLSADFLNFSWGTTTTIENGEWKVEISDGWGALQPVSTSPIANVTGVVFRARGSGQTVNVSFGDGGAFSEPMSINLSAEMQTFTVPHDRTPVSAIAWQDSTGNGLPLFYIDDIYLLIDDTPIPVPTASGDASVTLAVDPTSVQGAIDPHIYGISFAEAGLAAELDLPINRWGGNAITRYNWKESVSNRASDWYFLNVPDGAGDGVDVNNLPDTATFNAFIQQNLQTGTDSLLTAPMIGWTPNGRNDNCGFRVSQYGAQDSVEPFHPDCGNGTANGVALLGTSPEDTSIAIDETYTQEWLEYINNRYGTDAVQFVALDNEPMLWNHTHRDVHPEAVGYDEIRDLALQYAPAIKAANPNAKTLGPVVWGWTAYEFSAKDQADGGAQWWLNPPDRNAHGGQPFLEWYLDEMAAYESETGLRPLDYLDIHYYPQQAGVTLSNNVDLATQRLRLRSTRALWDPTYVDESWIGEEVQLIPRMKQMIEEHYPDTKLALTEYEWGATNHINGALAQADILGILGREGADMAMFWANPSPTAPVSHAFRMYRNYDGQGSKFGDTSVRATSTDQEKVSVYAATRNDNALTVVLVNKSLEAIEVTLDVANVNGTAQVYQYSEQNLGTIQRLDDRLINGNVVLPKNSVQLLVLDVDLENVPTTQPTATATDTPAETPIATATSTSTSTPVDTPTSTPTSTPMTTPVTTPMITPTAEMPTATMQPGETSAPEPTATRPSTTPPPSTATPPPPTATPVNEPTPQSGVITGQVFIDTNGNGVLDQDEEALSGVIALLIDTSTEGQTSTITSITDGEGVYRFVDVPPADYTLSFAIPSGYVSTGTAEVNLRMGGGNLSAPSLGVQVESDGEGTGTLPDSSSSSVLLPLIVN